jgi:hypothetical protein
MYTLDFWSKVTYHQIQDGGSRHYEKFKSVITQSVFLLFQKVWRAGLRRPIKLKTAKPEVTDVFKMAATVMLEIQMNAIKWAITTRFWWKLVHTLRKHAEFKSHQSGSVWPFSRWPPLLLRKLKFVLENGQLSPNFDEIWYTD